MKKNSIYNFFFYLCYILLIVNSTCNKIKYFDIIIKYNKYIIPIILFFVIILQAKKYSKKSIVRIIGIVSIGLISYYITKSNDIFLTFLLIICAKNIEIDDFIKKDVIVKLCIIFFVIICYKLGLAENSIMYREDGFLRSSLGFSHPNRLGMLIFSINCGVMYLHHGKYNWKDLVLIIVSLLICIKVCDSRSSQIGIVALTLITITTKFFKDKKIYKNILTTLPIILTIISIVSAFLYSKGYSFIYTINEIVSNRILYCYKFIEYYGINLFGNYFQYYGMWGISNRLSVLDNAYVHILVHFGLLTFLLTIGCFIWIINDAIKNKKYNVIIYLVPFLLYGLMEHHIFEIQYNSILIYASGMIYAIKKREKSKNNILSNNDMIIK